jgi:protein-tyrosine phosphatase
MIEHALPRSTGSLRIVFVCTANRFRSPLAAAFLRRLLGGVPVEVSSCGTARAARDGRGPLPEAIAAATSSTVGIDDHRTRWIGDMPLDQTDLVIGFERAHVAAAVLEGGAIRSHTFLLTEAVEVLHATDPIDVVAPRNQVRALVEAADRARRDVEEMPEVRDPFGHSRQVYERTAIEIWSLTLELAHAISVPPPVSIRALPRPRLRRALGPSWFR